MVNTWDKYAEAFDEDTGNNPIKNIPITVFFDSHTQFINFPPPPVQTIPPPLHGVVVSNKNPFSWIVLTYRRFYLAYFSIFFSNNNTTEQFSHFQQNKICAPLLKNRTRWVGSMQHIFINIRAIVKHFTTIILIKSILIFLATEMQYYSSIGL